MHVYNTSIRVPPTRYFSLVWVHKIVATLKVWKLISPSSSEEGCTPWDFLKQLFVPNKLRQMLPGTSNHFYILFASFDVYRVKLGGVIWVWGVSSKRMVEGVGEILWFLFLKYLTRYVLQTCYVDETRHFLTYSAKNPAKIPCSYDFLVKNWFLLIFMYIFNASKFPRAGWLYDVTVTSYEVQWYSFWYQWIEEAIPGTLVANIGISDVPYRKSRRGLQQPPLEDG